MRDEVQNVIIKAVGELANIMAKNNKDLDNVRTENEYEHLQGVIQDANIAMRRLVELIETKPSQVEGYGLSASIYDLNLSTRATNALKWLDIETVGGILATSPREILGSRNSGKKTLAEIMEKMQSLGFNWGFPKKKG